MYINIHVIATLGVKNGVNFTSATLSGNKIARGEAKYYLPLILKIVDSGGSGCCVKVFEVILLEYLPLF